MGLLLFLAAGWACFELWRIHWVSDDAFISFRYAENLSRGLGLVFNAGERVEGYTNFLWTVILAAGMRLRIDPVAFSAVLGTLAYFGTAATWALVSWRLHLRNPSTPFLPLACLGVLVQHDQHVFATCGLETTWVTWLVTLAFALLLFAQRPRDFYLAGTFLAIAALSRPDALIFLASALAFTFVSSENRLMNSVRLLAVPLILYLPYWAWRYAYYTFPFPNTYYAKSADLSYFAQGWRYIALYLESYYVLALVPLALGWLCLRVRRAHTSWSEARAGWLLLAFLVPYLLYVAKVGGDFMFGRFLLPVVGLGFFALECAVKSMPWRRTAIWFAAMLIVAAIGLRHDVFSKDLIVQGIADEPAAYPEQWHQHARESGTAIRSLFEGREVRVAFTGRYAMWVYYSQPAYAVEAETGLTDTALAHRPIAARGRPGHEKPATLEDLQQRRVHFLFRPPIPRGQLFESLRVVRLGDLEVLALRYDRELMNSFRGDPRVSFVDFPRWLDEAPSRPHTKGGVMELLDFAQAYYFKFNYDPERLIRLQQLAEASP